MNTINLSNEEIEILLDALIYATTKMGRDNQTSEAEIAIVKSLRKNIKSQTMKSTKYFVTFEAQGQTSTISANNRDMANQAFESYVRAKNLIAFDSDPSGYRYAHNEDLTIRCSIQSTPDC
jgi:hypothetical protein